MLSSQAQALILPLIIPQMGKKSLQISTFGNLRDCGLIACGDIWSTNEKRINEQVVTDAGVHPPLNLWQPESQASPPANKSCKQMKSIVCSNHSVLGLLYAE